jgi:hypothetical protein
LLDRRGEPFTADSGGRGGPLDAFFIYLPRAFYRQKDQSARVGGRLCGTTRNDAASGSRPAFRNASSIFSALGLRSSVGRLRDRESFGNIRIGVDSTQLKKGGALSGRALI